MSHLTQYRSSWGWPLQAKHIHTHNNETVSLIFTEKPNMKQKTQKRPKPSSQCCCCYYCCGCASFLIDPIHCRVRGHTDRQTDRHTLFVKICLVLKSCISDSSTTW